MRSGTSFFNPTVYKKTVFRFWPLWAVILVFWGVLLPMSGLVAIQNEKTHGTAYDYVENFATGLGEYGTEGALVFALIAGLLAAMAVCSHLYSAKSANFMAALPVKREALFLSHYTAGLTMLLAPNVVIFLLTLLVEVAGGAVEPIPLLFWLISLSAMEFFFYTFALCLGMFAGHLLALPVFYGVFNVLAAAVCALLDQIMGEFFFGYYSIGYDFALWFTPAYMLGQVDFDRGSGLTAHAGDILLNDYYRIEGASVLGIYAAAAVVLAVIALLVYRGRHLETAGDVVAVKSMRPVFKYGVALCSGLFLGYLFYLMLGGNLDVLMTAIILWGLIGYFVAQMFLDKSFRVFHKWKGAAAVTLAFAVLFLVVGLDLTGFERRVPDPEQVVSVEVRGLHSGPSDSADYVRGTFTDPDTIEKIVAIHQAVADDLYDVMKGGDYHTETYKEFRVIYTLKNGSTMTRDYDLFLDLEEDTPGTIAYAITQLLSDRDFVWELYGFDEAEEKGELFYVTDGQEPAAYYYEEDAAALLAAVKADFAAGTIGIRDLAGKESMYELTFVWQHPVVELEGSYSAETMPYEPNAPEVEKGMDTTYVTIAVPITAERTLAVLKELGGLTGIGEGNVNYDVIVEVPGGQSR